MEDSSEAVSILMMPKSAISSERILWHRPERIKSMEDWSDQGVYFFENAPYYPEIDAEGKCCFR